MHQATADFMDLYSDLATLAECVLGRFLEVHQKHHPIFNEKITSVVEPSWNSPGDSMQSQEWSIFYGIVVPIDGRSRAEMEAGRKVSPL